MGPPFPADLRYRREVWASDVSAIGEMVASTGFFTPAEIAVAVELVDERLQKGEASGYFFLIAEDGAGRVLGYACYGPVPATQSTYDLYWIVVDPAHQRGGLGRELLARAEEAIAAVGGVDVYVETSSRALYRPTRQFLRQSGLPPRGRVRRFLCARGRQIRLR